jgi:hypothetical protein
MIGEQSNSEIPQATLHAVFYCVCTQSIEAKILLLVLETYDSSE